jgi:hypothetical protein
MRAKRIGWFIEGQASCICMIRLLAHPLVSLVRGEEPNHATARKPGRLQIVQYSLKLRFGCSPDDGWWLIGVQEMQEVKRRMSETPPPPSPHENGLAHKASEALKKLISFGGGKSVYAGGCTYLTKKGSDEI